MIKKKPALFFYLCIAVFISLVFVLDGISKVDLKTIATSTSSNFESKKKEIDAFLISYTDKKNPKEKIDYALESFTNKQLGFYSYSNDSLIFWNNSIWEPNSEILQLKNEFGIVQLKQGLFFWQKKKLNTETLLCVALIQKKFQIQNNYLRNEYTEWTGLSKGITVSENTNSEYSISLQHQKLFSINSNELLQTNKDFESIALKIYLLAYILLLLSAFYYIKNSNNIFTIKSVLLLVILIRLLLLYFGLPKFLFDTPLFDVKIFGNAQSFLNGYLGDILLNSLLWLLVAYVYFELFKQEWIKKFLWVYFSAALCFAYFIFYQVNFNIKSFIANSTLNFDFVNLFSIDTKIIWVLISLSCLALALFVVLHLAVTSAKEFKIKNFLLVNFCIALFYFLFLNVNDKIEVLLFQIILFVYYAFHSFKINNFFVPIGVYTLCISLYCTLYIQKNIQTNQIFNYELLAQSQSEQRDLILENEFSMLPKKIQEDKNLINLINLLPSTEKEFVQKLKHDYFGGYFDRYTIDFSLFDEKCSDLITANNPIHLTEGYFTDQIKINSDTINSFLFINKNPNSESKYFVSIPLEKTKLFVALNPKQFEETGSFPEILIDENLQKDKKYLNINYGVYVFNKLYKHFGNLEYPYEVTDSIGISAIDNSMSHYLYSPNAETKVIVSEPKKTWNYFFTFNSYILLFFAFVFCLAYLIYAIVYLKLFKTSSLTQRIQVTIILLLLASMTTITIISVNVVRKQFESKNQKQLSEKTQTIISELNSQFKSNQIFDVSLKELLSLKLKEYARLFNTPITMFSSDGKLYTSSEAKLYNLGLASPLANPIALNAIKNSNSISKCFNANAGTLEYMSLYASIYADSKNLLGYINLPYFAKQNELNAELSNVISALINVYVILLVISILVGIILSSYITFPLRFIQEQFSKIALDKHNEKIIWRSNDEIGKLVFEYNLMITKLEESALQLARSERESAWREMAKQVAHEIKNPLTPMKLNLQYLQHLLKSNAPEFEEKFLKSSSSIIEQIDTLANIASEFSNFAQLPNANFQTINLIELLNSSLVLFENHNSVQIQNLISENNILIKGDKEQLQRVFNNILKNAVQALENTNDAKITITQHNSATAFTILIQDNGCGISDEIKPKIFSPNFTTKNSGTGLGLAMVKSIMQSCGGKVWFESEENYGTTFYLEFEIIPITHP